WPWRQPASGPAWREPGSVARGHAAHVLDSPTAVMSRPRPACTLRVQHPRHPTGPAIRHGRKTRARTTTRCIRIHALAAPGPGGCRPPVAAVLVNGPALTA